MQSVGEGFAFESEVVHNRTGDAAGESRLLKLSRTKEIASQDDRVFGVTSELEAAGDSICNSSLSGSSATEEPVDVWTVRRGVFGPSNNVV
jgi:hypothetical protein